MTYLWLCNYLFIILYITHSFRLYNSIARCGLENLFIEIISGEVSGFISIKLKKEAKHTAITLRISISACMPTYYFVCCFFLHSSSYQNRVIVFHLCIDHDLFLRTCR